MRKSLSCLGVVALGMALAAAPAQAAEGVVLAAGSPTAIPGSYIVKVRSGGDRLAASLGGRSLSGAFPGFAVTLSEKQARRLAADPSVEYVEQNQVVHSTATQLNPPWGLDRTDQRALPLDHTYSYTSSGRDVNVYVIDTGIRKTHVDFGGRARDGWDFVDNDPIADDLNGHGTHVAGIAIGTTYGIAKQAICYGVKVLGPTGSGTTAGVIAGVSWVTRNAVHPAVANMSIGGSASVAMDDAVRTSIASGVTYTVSAGGSNADVANFSPARVAQALTVGASTITDTKASSSNYGPGVDIYAPGQSILSAWNTSDTAANTLSGTSMSAPHVAGVAARYLQYNPAATPAEVSAAIVAAGTPVPYGRLLYWDPAL
ncbi:S8 family peptidase [Umezawaea endophytica]|uniref:S8 family peptidase n=1 Tax=Umezawaea endophytica TaxID=1654476 RepID=A0A9X3AJ67_9PSEU|nr:S8 family peptidase [Umezawaea endophytica]MCS7481350.1 S8 family peptidase [Umezawaea endophytica]